MVSTTEIFELFEYETLPLAVVDQPENVKPVLLKELEVMAIAESATVVRDDIEPLVAVFESKLIGIEFAVHFANNVASPEIVPLDGYVALAE